MNNCLPKLDSDPASATLGVYDLKGCADDKTMVDGGEDVDAVHKRFSKPHMWMGKWAWSKARHKYFEGKLFARRACFHVTPTAYEWLISRIERDCAFCIKHNLMDYSMVLSWRTLSADDAAAVAAYQGTGHQGAQPLVCVHDGKIHIIYCGIIDFLQPWVFAKKVAKVIKSLELNKATEPPPKYGKRFLERFRAIFDASGTEVTSAAGAAAAPAPAAVHLPPEAIEKV